MNASGVVIARVLARIVATSALLASRARRTTAASL
jgi:hypothetical protein